MAQMLASSRPGRSKQKIFQIGFNKCGTKSLAYFFAVNDVCSIHWDEGRIARSAHQRMQRGEDPFADYGNITFFSDMMYLAHDRIIETYKNYEYIHAHYGDSLFILNTRDINNWLRSRLRHESLCKRYMSALSLGGASDVIEYWKQEWVEHHQGVQAYFERVGGKLLTFDIEKDPVEKLTEFVRLHAGLELDPALYRIRNATPPDTGS